LRGPEVFGRHLGFRSAVEFFNKLKEMVRFYEKPPIEKSDIVWGNEIVIGEYVINNKEGFMRSIYKSLNK
jgi:hypothetical protein